MDNNSNVNFMSSPDTMNRQASPDDPLDDDMGIADDSRPSPEDIAASAARVAEAQIAEQTGKVPGLAARLQAGFEEVIRSLKIL